MDDITAFIEPGLSYAVATIGLGLTYKYLKFPDFTTLGSIVVGGIVTVFASNYLGAGIGLAIGALSGVLLGALTGVLARNLSIDPVLAGIISYTASFSVAYSLTTGGRVDLADEVSNWLVPVWSIEDAAKIGSILATILVSLAVFMRTRWGALLLAMTGDRSFVDFRHRSAGSIFRGTTMWSNGIVALAGGLFALNDYGANVPSHFDFLPFALGGIFAGNATTTIAMRVIHRNELADRPVRADGTPENSPGRLLRTFARWFADDGEYAGNTVFVFLSYAVGCFFLHLIYRIVEAQAYGLTIDEDLRYFLIAAIMAALLWWSGQRPE